MALVGKKKPKKILTPIDFIKGAKAKRAYMGNGECRVVNNIYKDINQVPKWEEVEKMDVETASILIKSVKALHTTKDCQSYWGLSPFTWYNKVAKKYDIGKADYSTRNFNGKNNKDDKNIKNKKEVEQIKIESVKEPVKNEHIEQLLMTQVKTLVKEQLNECQPIKSKGLNIADSGQYSKEQMETRVLGLMSTLLENSTYEFEINIKEVVVDV